MKKFLVILIVVLAVYSCKQQEPIKEKEIVAKVYERPLYLDDIKTIIPKELDKNDSIAHVENYVNKWIKKQILIHKAEIQLSGELPEIERRLEDYRAALLIHLYEQKYVEQHIDTSVNKKEIAEYYELHAMNFKLNHNVIKALYIKIPNSAPDAEKVKYLYRSTREQDSIELVDYCYQYAVKFDYFNNDWVSFAEILAQMPNNVINQSLFLKANKKIESQDSLFSYYLDIKNYKLTGDNTPLVFVKDNIRSVILTNRRIQLISQLENNLYREAEKNDEFEILKSK